MRIESYHPDRWSALKAPVVHATHRRAADGVGAHSVFTGGSAGLRTDVCAAQDMSDFADRISDDRAGRRLARAIRGRGAFRRFKDELHEESPDLLQAWYAFRDARAQRRAVEWLVDNDLVDEAQAQQYLSANPEPTLP